MSDKQMSSLDREEGRRRGKKGTWGEGSEQAGMLSIWGYRGDGEFESDISQ